MASPGAWRAHSSHRWLVGGALVLLCALASARVHGQPSGGIDVHNGQHDGVRAATAHDLQNAWAYDVTVGRPKHVVVVQHLDLTVAAFNRTRWIGLDAAEQYPHDAYSMTGNCTGAEPEGSPQRAGQLRRAQCMIRQIPGDAGTDQLIRILGIPPAPLRIWISNLYVLGVRDVDVEVDLAATGQHSPVAAGVFFWFSGMTWEAPPPRRSAAAAMPETGRQLRFGAVEKLHLEDDERINGVGPALHSHSILSCKNCSFRDWHADAAGALPSVLAFDTSLQAASLDSITIQNCALPALVILPPPPVMPGVPARAQAAPGRQEPHSSEAAGPMAADTQPVWLYADDVAEASEEFREAVVGPPRQAPPGLFLSMQDPHLRALQREAIQVAAKLAGDGPLVPPAGAVKQHGALLPEPEPGTCVRWMSTSIVILTVSIAILSVSLVLVRRPATFMRLPEDERGKQSLSPDSGDRQQMGSPCGSMLRLASGGQALGGGPDSGAQRSAGARRTRPVSGSDSLLLDSAPACQPRGLSESLGTAIEMQQEPTLLTASQQSLGMLRAGIFDAGQEVAAVHGPAVPYTDPREQALSTVPVHVGLTGGWVRSDAHQGHTDSLPLLSPEVIEDPEDRVPEDLRMPWTPCLFDLRASRHSMPSGQTSTQAGGVYRIYPRRRAASYHSPAQPSPLNPQSWIPDDVSTGPLMNTGSTQSSQHLPAAPAPSMYSNPGPGSLPHTPSSSYSASFPPTGPPQQWRSYMRSISSVELPGPPPAAHEYAAAAVAAASSAPAAEAALRMRPLQWGPAAACATSAFPQSPSLGSSPVAPHTPPSSAVPNTSSPAGSGSTAAAAVGLGGSRVGSGGAVGPLRLPCNPPTPVPFANANTATCATADPAPTYHSHSSSGSMPQCAPSATSTLGMASTSPELAPPASNANPASAPVLSPRFAPPPHGWQGPPWDMPWWTHAAASRMHGVEGFPSHPSPMRVPPGHLAEEFRERPPPLWPTGGFQRRHSMVGPARLAGAVEAARMRPRTVSAGGGLARAHFAPPGVWDAA